MASSLEDNGALQIGGNTHHIGQDNDRSDVAYEHCKHVLQAERHGLGHVKQKFYLYKQ